MGFYWCWLFEVSRELYLSTGWKSGEGQWHLLVTVTLSAVLCSSPINRNSLYKWGQEGWCSRGHCFSPVTPVCQGLLGLISVGQTALWKVSLSLLWLCTGLFKLEWTLRRALSALAYGDWVFCWPQLLSLACLTPEIIRELSPAIGKLLCWCEHPTLHPRAQSQHPARAQSWPLPLWVDMEKKMPDCFQLGDSVALLVIQGIWRWMT